MKRNKENSDSIILAAPHSHAGENLFFQERHSREGGNPKFLKQFSLDSCFRKNKALALLFLFFSALALFQSCAYPEEPKQVKFEDKFIIDFPSYLEECDDLTSDAVLQYKNAYRNTYSIIRVEPKNGQTFEEFQQKAVNQIKQFDLLKNVLVTDSFYRTTEMFNAIDLKLYGIMQDENIYYWNSCFETEDYFYEVVFWTRSNDRKQRYGADIERSIASFKPLK